MIIGADHFTAAGLEFRYVRTHRGRTYWRCRVIGATVVRDDESGPRPCWVMRSGGLVPAECLRDARGRVRTYATPGAAGVAAVLRWGRGSELD